MLLADRVKPDLDRRRDGDEADRRRRAGARAAATLGQHRRARTAAARRCSRSGGGATRRAGRPRSSLRAAVGSRPIRCGRRAASPIPRAPPRRSPGRSRRRRGGYGRWDVAWGDVHRVRRGTVDVPVGGCSGALGCFRVLSFARDAGRQARRRTPATAGCSRSSSATTPRAYSVLAYGQSPRSRVAVARRSGRDVRARRDEARRVHARATSMRAR